MRMLFFAHSGLRYLVLLAGIVAIFYFIYAGSTRRGNERVSRILGAIFVGAVDLQALIGVVMVVLGLYYPALIGHIFMMLGAAVVAHVAMAMAKSSEPSKANTVRAGGVVVALLLIVGGILAIGRSVFETGAPTMVY